MWPHRYFFRIFLAGRPETHSSPLTPLNRITGGSAASASVGTSIGLIRPEMRLIRPIEVPPPDTRNFP